MFLASPAFQPHGKLDERFGKRGANVSPPLQWGDLPPGTASLALSIVDHHSVANEYVHWLVADIQPDAAALAEGAAAVGLPQARELSPYEGPFPPSGTHDYEFTLYALDVPTLDANVVASLAEFLTAVEPHTLATATLIGSFTRR